jgi:uncharacterized protein YjdB
MSELRLGQWVSQASVGEARSMHSIVISARRMSWMGASLLLAASLACNTDATNPDGSAVDSIAITPPSASLMVGSSVALNAAVLDANGEVIPSLNVAWASEDTLVAQVSSTGVVTGMGAGSVRIAASSWGKNAVATITVNHLVLPAVARIVIAPADPRITVGQSVQLVASILDNANRVINGMTIVWSSSNTIRATVDQSGLVKGVTAGTVTITASAGGKSGTTSVRIDR